MSVEARAAPTAATLGEAETHEQWRSYETALPDARVPSISMPPEAPKPLPSDAAMIVRSPSLDGNCDRAKPSPVSPKIEIRARRLYREKARTSAAQQKLLGRREAAHRIDAIAHICDD